MKSWLNEKIYVPALTIGAGLFLWLQNTSTLQEITVVTVDKAANIALFFPIVFLFEYFLLGIGRDIKNEVFTEHNTAGALYMLGIMLSVALMLAL